MKKICFVATVEFVVNAFLVNHLRALCQIYNVTVVVNTNDPLFLQSQGINATVIPLNIARDIDLSSDVNCLLQLTKLFYQEGFVAVHSITPKAGILAMLAARLVQVPLRIHTFTGQVWANKIGYKRKLLKFFDYLMAFFANHIIVDSRSQYHFLLKEGVLNPKKSVVFGSGSVCGVELTKFKYSAKARFEIRSQLNISQDRVVFLFLGRLNLDKGVLDLASAFSSLSTKSACLLYVGPDEQSMQAKINTILHKNTASVHFIGHTNVPEDYISAADVLCLPSYREGFGSVVIEAAAVGIPTIASRIYGLTDAVIEGETGLMHEPGAIDEIENCMSKMIQHDTLRLRLGERAQMRAKKEFDSKLITQKWVNFYHESIHINA